MQLGSKIKAVMAISQRLGMQIRSDSLHKVVSYRNPFAHHSTSAHPTLVAGKTEKEDDVHYMLQIIRQSGKTDRMSRSDALEDFNKHYKIAKETFVKLLDAVKKDFGEY